jgi:glycerophosphoryl diester phosphodiesterase
MATPEFLHRADSIGRSVHVWTVNDRDEMERLIRLGVDNIITDDPLVFFSIMKEKTGIPDLGFSWEPYLD